MAVRNLLLLVSIVTVVSGCQTWQADKMPPTASLPQISETGVVEARYWDNLGDGGISSVTSLDAYPDNPDEVVSLNELRSPQNRADYYGSLVRGFIIPPSDGIYRFFVAGDNNAQFWLSTDENPDNIQMIGSVPGWTSPNDYSKYSSQASGTIELTGENRYYFEIRHKELDGGDHFSVAWEGPGFSRQLIGADSIASLGQSPYDQEEAETAYSRGYRIGFFDGTQALAFDSSYPPLDQDRDGLYDNWETFHGLDPNDPTDATSDADGDILNALDEFWLGTDPNNPDTDGDGIPDGVEFANELNPLNPEDANEDLDGDGATNLEEHRAGTDLADASSVPVTSAPQVSGFLGQYFTGRNFDRFERIRQDQAIDFNWSSDGPIAELGQDNFSVRWSGVFTPPHSSGVQQYEFTTLTDDGVRLHLDGNLVIDEWKNQAATAYSHTLGLQAQEAISITMEYYQAGYGAEAGLTITDLNSGEALNTSETVTAPDPTTVSNQDTDGDGIPDTWELAHGLNPWINDASDISNDSGVTNLEAYRDALDPWTLEPTTGQSEPPATTEPEPAPDTTSPGEVTLSWTAPLTRTDGSSMSLSAIDHYEIVYGQEQTNLGQSITAAGDATSAEISGLESGTWYFSIRVIDINGLESELSAPIEHSIP
ncbi:PA14 domain-containing protein [Marinobacter zhanjiangensis]|uniref:PA14 domain-containing protein n=1 Tax=Marinobacter zhanjiangensis TaxID=578215 RepID=A0ABQ3B695_9GAMM|nr:PA14 domain-containing protein [Marinobacter zhanjiangensis]GGY80278.1 hypothetical protein GCM10007071_29500 [Marinobacter zhanjiangensis]